MPKLCPFMSYPTAGPDAPLLVRVACEESDCMAWGLEHQLIPSLKYAPSGKPVFQKTMAGYCRLIEGA